MSELQKDLFLLGLIILAIVVFVGGMYVSFQFMNQASCQTCKDYPNGLATYNGIQISCSDYIKMIGC